MARVVRLVLRPRLTEPNDGLRITCGDESEVHVPGSSVVGLFRLVSMTDVGPGSLWKMINGRRGTRPLTRHVLVDEGSPDGSMREPPSCYGTCAPL